MGAIEEIYEDIETEVSEAEFREAVAQKVDQMEGLADEETAAMILAHELAGGEIETIADIEAGMDEVKFLGKITSIGEVRTFDRDDGEGRVVNVEVADETGTVVLTFWDGRAEAVVEELDSGDVLRVKGRPRDGYRGLEVSVDEAERDDDVEIDVTPGEETAIETLSLGQSDVNLRGVVLDTGTIRTFDRDDGSTGKVSNLTLGDETGRIRVTLWDDRAERVPDLDPGTAVEVVDGYVREREGDLELHISDRGRLDETDEAVEYDPDATPVEAVEIGQTVDIAGVVRSTDPIRTFDRDDGSEGQVRNIRLQDETDDIRVALWGEKADIDVAPGDEILVADAEIQDGWQDDLEASAGWQSTVALLDSGASITDSESTDGTDTADRPSAGGNGAATADRTSDGTGTSDGTATSEGLGAFADGDAPSSPADGAVTAGEQVEFTGTVVQTGDPVVLDNGTETMSVQTDAQLRLGEEVTARGTVADGRLDAEELL